MKLDETDRQLLALLREDARRHVSSLAEALGVSRATVYGRIARMEEERIITGYTVRVGAEHHRRMIRAHMMIKVQPKFTREIERALAIRPELTTLHAISGEYDFIAEIEAPDPEALNELIDAIGMLDGVARTTSSIILATKVQR
ncbi:AsnC family transcriptional regulator [Nostoc sp. 3335mG]|nr:AsnC family transcriptional regulator [Nostoc sp. 3335mG]